MRLLNGRAMGTSGFWTTAAVVLVAAVRLTGPVQATEGFFENTAKPFLKAHCIDCHGPKTARAELRLDRITDNFNTRSMAAKWTEVFDQLTRDQMPPEKSKNPRPTPAEVVEITEWIAGQLRDAARSSDSETGIVLRRLNRDEYNNTVRDLVGIDFQPANDFPVDTAAHGFDNVGSALVISPLHLEKYLAAARQIIDRSIIEGPRPTTHKWHMEVEKAHSSNQFPGRESAGESELWVPDPVSQRHRYLLKGGGLFVKDGFLVQKGSKGEDAAGFRWFKIPAEGEYIVRIRAAGVVPTRNQVVDGAKKTLLEHHREHDWEKQDVAETKWLREEWPDIAEHFMTDPIYGYGFPRMKVVDERGQVVGEINVEASTAEPQIYEFRHSFAPRKRGTDSLTIRNTYSVPPVLENHWFQNRPSFERPELWIDWVEFEGPLAEEWPPESHRRILFDSPNQTNEDTYAREVIERFMSRAYRRPPTSAEIERMVGLYRKLRPSQDSFVEAIKVPLIAVLASPPFLYLVEPTKQSDRPRPLTDHELASRLSYFLWSTMPDETLFNLAREGVLRDPKTLRAQVDRMLKDPRSRRFVSNFAGQWLSLRKVGTVVPDRSLYPHHDDHLQESIVRETEAFFAHILDNDLSVLSFLDSDFAVLNGRMARFYGVPHVSGDRFRPVAIEPEHRRGGLLTHASMLTLTSNGTRTSPVIRGVWLLENILGTPAPPPPPDAGDIQPKVPGIDKASVRVRLEHHRKIPQCAACHAKIDPLGFALENFNAIGQWREKEGFGYKGRVGHNDPDVDASGRLPDGRHFQDIDEFKSILLSKPYTDLFCKCLAEKLMTYALGRGLGYTDRTTVSRLTQRMQTNGYRMKDLIAGIVLSEAFLTK